MVGFKQAKAQLIDCLRSGRVRHEERGDIEVKNLLATGMVTPAQVESLVSRARGGDHSCSPHHFDRKILVHTIKVRHEGGSWYIKWYFLEPNAMCISVHV